jgi:hypothetical protein
MSHSFKTPAQYFLTFGMMALLFSPIGCGAVGPPIPPEKVGIEGKKTATGSGQKRRNAPRGPNGFPGGRDSGITHRVSHRYPIIRTDLSRENLAEYNRIPHCPSVCGG